MAASDSRSQNFVENDALESEAEPAKVSCTEIIVVRHGETEWNVLGKMQGQTDIDLNEAGRQQAVIVAERLSKEFNITAIYSSDLKRALETAETIASKCGGLEVSDLYGKPYAVMNQSAFFLERSLWSSDDSRKVIKDKDLRERHIGDLQGLTYHESPKVNPKAFEALKSCKLDQEIPGGGESKDQLYKRCTSSLQRIAEKRRGGQVVAVTHGGVIEMLYKRLTSSGGRYRRVFNTSINIIQLFEGDTWSIKLWNDISHLRETEFLQSACGGGGSSS